MRNYLLSTNGEDRSTKEQIIISLVKEAENDPVSQNAILQLIPPPIITNDLNKGKGIIFGYYTDSSSQPTSHGDRGPKLMSAAISAGCSSNVQSQEHELLMCEVWRGNDQENTREMHKIKPRIKLLLLVKDLRALKTRTSCLSKGKQKMKRWMLPSLQS
ncbi:Uncharacterized protein Rs2_02841 [Raphanus sativus]|nr:Uncharacterized protein Rs2_02841 [Raphanus sativus]